MKNNLLIASIAFLVLLGLMSSCGSRTELIKRHYNKGFYVAGNPHRSEPSSRSHNCLVTTKKVTRDVATDAKDPVGEVVALAMPRPIVASAHQTPYNLKDKGIVKKRDHVSIMPGRIISFSLPQKINNELKELSKAKTSNSNGYSLLWIIVVILLIFWLLGFLTGGFGIGNLINLLLVVALILFILWLLKVL